jgi:hypothetical protein
MTNFYKLSGQDIYWKITDDTTTVFQIKNSTNAKSISKTTNAQRYNSLIQYSSTWTVIDETEFNTVFTEVFNGINN